MSKGRPSLGSVEERRKSLQSEKSEEAKRAFTIAGVKKMYEGIPAKRIHCTISGYCRTQIFEFPKSSSQMAQSQLHEMIFKSDSICAHLVTDLLNYFAIGTNSPHYSISPPLRFNVKELDQKIKSQRKEQFPVFVVIEEFNKIPPVIMDKGECCISDEIITSEGKKTPALTGGREGEEFITAWMTSDGNWPETPENQCYVNMILTAVRVEQEAEGPIRKHLDQECFVTDDGHFVATMWSTASARLSVVTPLDEKEYKKKAIRIRNAIVRLEPDMLKSDHIYLLINSMYYDEHKDNEYNRLYYLQLWQSLADTYRFLSGNKFKADGTTVAGNKTLEKITEYRNKIAHWWVSRIDAGYLEDIIRTINELLRKKYF